VSARGSGVPKSAPALVPSLAGSAIASVLAALSLPSTPRCSTTFGNAPTSMSAELTS